jgi:hypothetical protein
VENKSRGGTVRLWVVAGIVLLAAVLVMVGCDQAGSHNAEVKFTTPYQAVLLTNGAVYFGKLQGYGTDNPVLTEVYYVVSTTNADTKQVNNMLVKRGKQELHKPDRMYLNPKQILFVEPVGTDSRVAQLIKEQGGQ